MVTPFSCPQCNDKLVVLYYHQMKIKNGKKTGDAIKSNFFFCRKCKLVLSIKISKAQVLEMV